MKLGWSTDFLVLDGEAPAAGQLARIGASKQGWIVIVRAGNLFYVFSRDELWQRLRGAAVPSDPQSKARLYEVLDLHETQSSTVVSNSAQLAPPDLSWRPNETAPSVQRYVEISATSTPVAVGGSDVIRDAAKRALPARGVAPDPTFAPPLQRPAAGAMPPQPSISRDKTTLAVAPPTPAADDEGTTPVRHPSIEPAGALKRGEPVILVVDLMRTPSPNTSGGPLQLGAQQANWSTLELAVTLVSDGIDFDDGGRASVTIRRNQSSLAARVTGTVHANLADAAAIDVSAQFWDGTRCCGVARRQLALAGAGAPAPTQVTSGDVRVDLAAEKPDLTVFITLLPGASRGLMHWRMETAQFDGLPPKLDGFIDLGTDAASEAAAMFRQFASLERGKHRARIEGFGEKLWDRAPAEFRELYWVLHNHYQRPLTIQFISDDPHLPWELMRPYRKDEVHPPLALRHAVARWIGRYAGYLSNRLPAGRVVTIAPRYPSAKTRLSTAEATAARLVQRFRAEALQGTLSATNNLLEHPSADPVALIYFTGHGLFNAAAADASAIKLEDGNLAVDEVRRSEVKLGERWGTVVFFNACEVGATASALGSVGGWADAFASRKFRGFIAPLWAIDEEDASQVTDELMTKIITEGVPIATALRDLRKQYGDVSPTFYSYLLYGDVTARLAV